jgi:hypothetical protein
LYYGKIRRKKNPAYGKVSSSNPTQCFEDSVQMKNPDLEVDPEFRVLFDDPHKSKTL